ncbi:MAG TPA: hypothetical protein VGQ30_13455 [Gemmatimonadaceae bacterium]|nr:hypothetical protein [Gemmatimonadaceae bacterium]
MTTNLVAVGGTTSLASTMQFTAIPTAVAVKPDSAYALLELAYKRLDIPIGRFDAATRSVTNEALKVRRRIGGLAMQAVVDCGEKLGVANAETWDIDMNVLSFVVDDGRGGSRVSTRIQALGHDPIVAGRDYSPCSTKGALEAKIGNTVKLLTVPAKK